jgi:hypothetical protein
LRADIFEARVLENTPLNSIILTLVTSRPTDPQLQFYIHEADLPGILYMTLTLVTSRPTDPQLQFYIHKADLPGIYDPHTGHQQAH